MIPAPLFPVLGSDGQTVPWSWLAPHEVQAHRNHGQSFAELARRGGLDWVELVAIVEGRGIGWVITQPHDESARTRVLALVADWRAGVTPAPPSGKLDP